MKILDVKDLSVRFTAQQGTVNAVNQLSFSVAKSRTLGIVGESGSGKSQSMLALMGLLAGNGRASGQALYHGNNLLAMTPKQLNQVRGNKIAMVFQDPMTSLNPYLSIERQMTEVLEVHKGASRSSARAQALRMLDAVRIPESATRIRMFPHEFSGGMRQRVMIAMALLCQPELLIADEPTTALDVTVQAQILNLMRELQSEFSTAIILITHDLGVIAGLCDEVIVMYAGSVMEQGPVRGIFKSATHPYTQGLLNALPRINEDAGSLRAIPGSPPSVNQLPSGCPFHPRCAMAIPECASSVPSLLPIDAQPGRFRACLREVQSQTSLSEDTHA